MLELCLIILGLIAVFVILGLLGWAGAVIGWIFDILFEGIENGFGCIVRIILLIIGIMCLLALII